MSDRVNKGNFRSEQYVTACHNIQSQSVTTQMSVLWGAIFLLWVELRSVSMEPGELCAVMAGEMKRHKSYVDNLDSQLTVTNYMYMYYHRITFGNIHIHRPHLGC